MLECRSTQSKMLQKPDLADRVNQAKINEQVVVFTNGCFDILHIGHIRYLQAARALGDLLVVGVNSDESVRRLKGSDRPVNAECERLELLASLECVDYCVLFGEDTPDELILTVKPTIHAKGGDYKAEDLPEAEVVRQVGGRVEIIPFSKTDTQGKSTTNLIERISRQQTGVNSDA